jgi:transcription initiation factor IIE alpha subunit
MSVHRPPHPTHIETKLTILETVLRQNNVRLSALAERLSLDDSDTHSVLSELRNDELVSTCPLRGEDDSVITSLPRLRGYERTKLHRLVYT